MSLTAVPDSARHMVFLLRAYTGSRRHLMVVARDLLAQSALGVGTDHRSQSNALHNMLPSPSRPGHLLAATSLRTRASVRQSLDAARKVEASLQDGHPGARPTISVDLLWMEGVSLDLPGLKLPAAEIAGDSHIALAFGQALSQWGKEAIPDDGERTRLAQQIEDAPEVQESSWGEPFTIAQPWMVRKPEGFTWVVFGRDLAELLAEAGNAVAVARMERARPGAASLPPIDDKLAHELDTMESNEWSEKASRENWKVGDRVKESMEAVQALGLGATARVSLDVPVPLDMNALALRWVREVQEAARKESIVPAMVLVTAVEATQVRGIVLGAKLKEPVPPVEIRGVTLRGGTDQDAGRFTARVTTGGLFHE